MVPFEFDPIRSASLIKPLDERLINSSEIKSLYQEQQLTQEEYILLDYLGAVEQIKDGANTISFQGLKRKIHLHQAKLTKALKRLIEKQMLVKTDGGYQLSDHGLMISIELMKKFGRQSTLEQKVHSHVAHGMFQGLNVSEDQLKELTDHLSGRWFGDFRFIAKTESKGIYEIEWISTNGSICTKLTLGPNNQLSIITSSATIIHSEIELQMMMERITSTIERLLDISVVFVSRTVYEDRRELVLADDVPIKFAS
jgi:Mn-dependent DtxR family transcriptional regulator